MKFLATRPLLSATILSLGLLLLREMVASADGPTTQDTARLQYARAYVTMTRLEMQIAQARNQMLPNTFPRAVIAGLQEHVAVSETWLREAESRAVSKPYNVALETALILSRTADELYVNAVKLNQVVGIDPQQLELLRIKVELARLRVATAKEIDLNTPGALAQFQLERLREEVAELNEHRVRIGDVD
jgi:hypothetical protein